MLSQSTIIGIMDEATDLIHILNPEGQIVYANHSWQKTLDISSASLVGLSIHDFIAPEQKKLFQLTRQRIIEAKAINVPVTTTFVSKTGTKILVEGFFSCHLKDDMVVYTQAILRDVTKLRENEQNFYQLITHAPDGIIVIDEHSRIKLWNPRSEVLFGWAAEEVNGVLMGETIIPEKYREMHYAGMKRLLTTGEAHVLNKTIEITAMHKSGNEFHIALTISKTTVNNEILFIAFIRDISAQKQMQLELLQQREKLEQSNIELTQYATLASHDLKEPIRKILTFSDLLIRPQIDKPAFTQEQLVDKIHRTAKKMQAIVTSIGHFSSISIKDIESVPITQILQELMIDMQDEIALKGATIQFSNLPVAAVNKTHIYQLVGNLINNSLKYSSPLRTPEIIITATRRNDYFEIIVSDNGLGFSNAFAGKIFEPFQRLHGKAYEGTGIGLSICKKIVELYGGEIYANGAEGQGAQIIFSLPACRPAH